MIADIVINIFVFLFGICIGSFLNCVIYRLEKDKKVTGRSFCPHCMHQLSWRDLFPVFSFLCLLGKCRYCHKKISIQYPLVELATGILFVLLFWSLKWLLYGPWDLGFGFWGLIEFVFLFYVFSALIIIFIYDLKHYLIPDKILLPAIIIASAYRLLENLIILNWELIFNYLLAVIIASGFFFLIWWISQGKWMGFGDVKLAILMGILLGVQKVLLALFLSFFLGAIIGIILMVFKNKKMKSEIPFGPFLIIGTLIAFLFGKPIIDWYLGFLIF